MNKRILLVGDDVRSLKPLMDALMARGLSVSPCANTAAAPARIRGERFDAAVFDVPGSRPEAVDLFRCFRERHPEVPAFVMSEGRWAETEGMPAPPGAGRDAGSRAPASTIGAVVASAVADPSNAPAWPFAMCYLGRRTRPIGAGRGSRRRALRFAIALLLPLGLGACAGWVLSEGRERSAKVLPDPAGRAEETSGVQGGSLGLVDRDGQEEADWGDGMRDAWRARRRLVPPISRRLSEAPADTARSYY